MRSRRRRPCCCRCSPCCCRRPGDAVWGWRCARQVVAVIQQRIGHILLFLVVLAVSILCSSTNHVTCGASAGCTNKNTSQATLAWLHGQPANSRLQPAPCTLFQTLPTHLPTSASARSHRPPACSPACHRWRPARGVGSHRSCRCRSAAPPLPLLVPPQAAVRWWSAAAAGTAPVDLPAKT